MSFAVDPEVEAATRSLVERAGAVPPLPRGEVAERRRLFDPFQEAMHAQLPTPTDVTAARHETVAEDGAPVVLSWYTKDGHAPGSAVVYCHGGGMIQSSPAVYHGPVARHVSATGVPFLVVHYRKAPESPAPAPVLDCVAGLEWLAANAEQLGVDPNRIAVMGDSGGGGIAASVAIYARDHDGAHLAKQILIYPMLDDRTLVADEKLSPFVSWTYDDNATGWGALLGDTEPGAVSPYAAPARLTDYSDLPDCYIEVGELDIFRDESVAYALELWRAGVSTELHVHPGAPHAFEAFAPDAGVSARSQADRHRVLSAL